MSDRISPFAYIGNSVDSLPTPALLVDRQALRRNLREMQHFLEGRGKFLRPHAKAHKSSGIASLQIDAGAIGMCAAKLSEAEMLLAKGIPRVLLTGPLAGEEACRRLVKTLQTTTELIITIDSLDNACQIARFAESLSSPIPCLIDMDPGYHRSGMRMEDTVRMANELRAMHQFRICGMQCYAGDFQHIVSRDLRASRSRKILKSAAEVFRKLKTMGMAMEIFSVGGTGTAAFDADIPEVTEIQAGSYALMDTEYASIEWPDFLRRPGAFEHALTLLSTVISCNHRGFATIDAGLKTLYRDGGLPQVIHPKEPGCTYDWFGDEYGKITAIDEDHRFTLGEKIQMVVPHADPCVNLFDFIYAVEEDVVVDVYPVDLRGCSQ